MLRLCLSFSDPEAMIARLLVEMKRSIYIMGWLIDFNGLYVQCKREKVKNRKVIETRSEASFASV